ncbi:C-glycoside deglycosidase beta subunit domain-containing protein [Candidatus Enterococcus murrayae]|uniref:C-deglycosylation enzyme beta subunit n=1 Tax=Candidatus Enterococcus murrayae TaxID=2815321 RepID=A0ABS3HGS2_9ENTE|nr:DUF6379 domain-containing protein [Enterococcus sp. MJM16]MBO0452637.1 D-mannonate dehydratase [Enterococcus sp. MJM16]
MLEKECIQSRGFKNIVEDNEKVGFQFEIRLMYYRGLWLSQIRPISVKIDGEAINQEDILWEIEGEEYTQTEMEKIGDIQWNVLTPAIIRVKKNGGLESGYHDLEIDHRFSSSYMPPDMDEVLSFGSHKRRLLLI